MKLGLLTFHFASNYGAVLQTFALYKTLIKMGGEVEVINYVNKSISQSNNLFPFSSWSKFFRRLFYAPMVLIRTQKVRRFLKKSVKIIPSRKLKVSDLQDVEKKYDKIICGSDQIWNYQLTNDDYTYFLEFCSDPLKKTAYAPSFGLNEIDKNRVNKIADLLNDFTFLSAREEQGRKIINDLTGKNVPLVLDPTLLLDKDEWRKESSKVKYKAPYILVYSFGSSSLDRFANNLSNQTGLPIIYLGGSIKNSFGKNTKNIIGCKPSKWLSLFANSAYVITNSFHGTCFAINFNKNFFVELLSNGNQVNSRVDNILNMFDLKSRQIMNGENLDLLSDIDYSEVNRKLILYRNESKQYLRILMEK